jgi:uncharacterized oxidoreductase
MKIKNKTVLISGGGSGIGFEIAKLLSAAGNKIIIIGRNVDKINRAARQLNNVTAIPCDVTSEKDVINLVSRIKADFSDLSIVINNAGLANVFRLAESRDAHKYAQEEIDINYLSVVRLNDHLLPILREQQEAAIANVTSIVVFAPGLAIPTYSASKAALHSYTTLLRESLKNTNVKVFELYPPLVNTDMSKSIGGEQNGIPPQQVAEQFIAGVENDEHDIYVGMTNQLYPLFLSSPESAFKMLNAIE